MFNVHFWAGLLTVTELNIDTGEITERSCSDSFISCYSCFSEEWLEVRCTLSISRVSLLWVCVEAHGVPIEGNVGCGRRMRWVREILLPSSEIPAVLTHTDRSIDGLIMQIFHALWDVIEMWWTGHSLFLWKGGTNCMCYCPTLKRSPYRRLCISTFPPKNSLGMIYKRFELWGHGAMSWKVTFILSYPCQYTNSARAHARTHAHTHTHSLSHTLSLSHAHIHTHTHTHTLSQSHTAHTHTHSLSKTQTHTRTHTHSHKHTLSLSHTHKHAHTHYTHAHTTHTHTIWLFRRFTACLKESYDLAKNNIIWCIWRNAMCLRS